MEGVGVFTLEEEDMWASEIDLDGQKVKVFLHTYEVDFETLASYAKRVLARRPLPDQLILDDVQNGIESLKWKFTKFGFDVKKVDIRQFRIERLLFGKNLDGPEIEMSINLQYPGDRNQWHLAYYSEDRNGMLNWIPRSD